MAKFPTMEEFVRDVVEKALDDWQCDGKTLKEWVTLVVSGNLVEVVRCKDCKHSSYDPVHGDYWCGGQRVFAEHFCSVGERREGE